MIASATRTEAFEVVEFEGAHRMQNRDAIGFYFGVRLEPKTDRSRVVVVFSGTVMSVQPEAFGLPSFRNRDDAFVMFAVTALGDYLDASGLPARSVDGGAATSIDCFSPQFQVWRDRGASTDAAIVAYISAHVDASWGYGHASWLLGPSDLLRLNCTLKDAMRIVRLHEGESWTVSDVSATNVTLTALPAFLRARRAPRVAAPLPVTVETIAVTHANTPPTDPFVDETRISELRALSPARLDTRKLVALCEELNHCYRAQCYHAVAALTRAVLDHVPPLFGVRTFAEVANNYAGSRSFKEVARNLEDGARKVGDMHLHTVIRASEVLPTRVQVNCAGSLDVVLSEIVRLHQPAK